MTSFIGRCEKYFTSEVNVRLMIVMAARAHSPSYEHYVAITDHSQTIRKTIANQSQGVSDPEKKSKLREVYLYYFLYCSRREKLFKVTKRHPASQTHLAIGLRFVCEWFANGP